jgi:2-phospho-L-lactate guanylyltransferase
MILIRSPKFRTCYRGLSFPKHLDYARQAGLKAEVFESFRAGCDIDEPEDLAEVLLHGRGETRALLEKMEFSVSKKGRGGGIGKIKFRL